MTANTSAPPAAPAKSYIYTYNQKRPRSEIRWGMVVALAWLHAMAFLAIGLHVWSWGVPTAKVWWTAAGMYLFCGFGISMGYHRLFTHEGFKTSKTMRAILLVAGGMSLQGPVWTWVGDHRVHHKHSDLPGDLHSPYQYPGIKGVLWAHMGWLFNDKPARPPRGDQPSDFIRQDRWNWVLVLMSLGIPFAVCGWDGLLVAGFLRVIVFLHTTWCINSVCHLVGNRVSAQVPGRSVRRVRDGSRNFAPLKLPSLGESNHNRHHLYSVIAYHGWSRFSIDPTKWLLIVLEWLHLVWAVEKPPTGVKEVPAEINLPAESLVHRREVDRAAA